MKKGKQGLLWQIDLELLPGPSYVFGTMHVKDKRAFQSDHKVYEKIEACTGFATEFNLEEIPTNQDSHAFILPDGLTVTKLIGEKKYAKLRRILIHAFQIDILQFNQFQPLLICNLIGEAILSQDRQHSLDAHLWHYAQMHEKYLAGIETYQEQVEILKKISLSYQAKALMAIGKNVKRHRRQLTKMTNLYQEGNIQKIYRSARNGAGKLRKTLLFNRNRIMADRIAGMAKEKTFFFAIGAGHLGGGKGVLRLLKQRGFSIKSIPSTP